MNEPAPIGRTNPSTRDQANVVIHPPVLWVLMFAVGFGFHSWAPWRMMDDGVIALRLGIAVWAVGMLLVIVAVVQFRRAGTQVQTHTPTSAIVETGLYARSRNPIYVGAHLGLAGAAIALNSVWILVTLIPFFLVIRYGVIGREEKYLERKFGDAYLAYKSRVRRWI